MWSPITTNVLGDQIKALAGAMDVSAGGTVLTQADIDSIIYRNDVLGREANANMDQMRGGNCGDDPCGVRVVAIWNRSDVIADQVRARNSGNHASNDRVDVIWDQIDAIRDQVNGIADQMRARNSGNHASNDQVDVIWDQIDAIRDQVNGIADQVNLILHQVDSSGTKRWRTPVLTRGWWVASRSTPTSAKQSIATHSVSQAGAWEREGTYFGRR